MDIRPELLVFTDGIKNKVKRNQKINLLANTIQTQDDIIKIAEHMVDTIDNLEELIILILKDREKLSLEAFKLIVKLVACFYDNFDIDISNNFIITLLTRLRYTEEYLYHATRADFRDPIVNMLIDNNFNYVCSIWLEIINTKCLQEFVSEIIYDYDTTNIRVPNQEETPISEVKLKMCRFKNADRKYLKDIVYPYKLEYDMLFVNHPDENRSLNIFFNLDQAERFVDLAKANLKRNRQTKRSRV